MRSHVVSCLLLLGGQAFADTFVCQRINAGAAPDFVVGRFVKAGARGKVHEITGAGIPPNSVVKIYEPEHEPPFSAEQVEAMAERYHAIHKLFPNNAMPVHGVKETSVGR